MITPSIIPPNASLSYYSSRAGDLFIPLAALFTTVFHLAAFVVWPIPSLRTEFTALPATNQQPNGKVVIITGSNTGVGYETAKALTQRGYEVVMACRSRDKALKAVENIQALHPSGKAVFVHPLDLSSFSSVRDFARVILQNYDKIHVLINNAGINISGLKSNKLDLCFQSNFLGHFLLTHELLPNIVKAKGRVINLSSVMHHFCRSESGVQDEAYWKQQCFGEATTEGSPNCYSASKLAAILFSKGLNERYRSKGLRSIAVNPGAVNSDIWRHFPRFIIPIFGMVYLNTEQGCYTSVAATVLDDQDLGDSVEYLQPYWLPSRTEAPFPVLEMLGKFCGYRPSTPRLPNDGSGGLATSQALWSVSEEMTGCKYEP